MGGKGGDNGSLLGLELGDRASAWFEGASGSLNGLVEVSWLARLFRVRRVFKKSFASVEFMTVLSAECGFEEDAAD